MLQSPSRGLHPAFQDRHGVAAAWLSLLLIKPDSLQFINDRQHCCTITSVLTLGLWPTDTEWLGLQPQHPPCPFPPFPKQTYIITQNSHWLPLHYKQLSSVHYRNWFLPVLIAKACNNLTMLLHIRNCRCHYYYYYHYYHKHAIMSYHHML